jgi:AcrR family transcriptional regulator
MIMDFQLSFKVNNKIYLRDPETSELGKKIVKNAIDLIYKLGFENFTIKKLSTKINTTEATVYRYFENKHRLLLYILNWYWYYMEFLVMLKLQNITNEKAKLKTIIELLTHELPESAGQLDYNKKYLNQIVIAESSKVYLVKEVKEINKNEVFKPYKDLCAAIALVISAYNPTYKYPRSLSSTLIETAHYQQFFSAYLPKLTDVQSKEQKEFATHFLSDLLFKVLS